jgi:hypothetical protein
MLEDGNPAKLQVTTDITPLLPLARSLDW